MLTKKEAIELGIKLKSLITLGYLHSGHPDIFTFKFIDDANQKTILSVSSNNKFFKEQKVKPKEIAFKVGEKLGDLINENKIKDNFTFDRGSYLYHGRIKELAMGIRSKGIKF